MQEQDDPIPLLALQHAVYCQRQAALIHIERRDLRCPHHRTRRDRAVAAGR
jgi:hypothetical protein